MKSIITLFLLLALCFVPTAAIHAQSVGDYRSAAPISGGGGVWNTTGFWQRWNGAAWALAPAPPNGSETITIVAGDSININVAVSISGTLRNQGRLGGTPSLSIANGGTYEHAQNSGSIPVANWSVGSTCKVTGYESGSKPNNSNQSFHHFVWNCPNQTSNVDLAMTGNTIGGNLTVNSSGVARVQLTSPTDYANPITIMGNIYVTAGQFASNGSGSLADIVVHTHGDIIVTSGNFSVSRGSGTNVIWNLYGNFSVTNATLQNSGGVTRTQKLVFAKAGTQSMTLSNVQYGGGTAPFTMEVKNGATLNVGTSEVTSSNSGSFLINAGATVTTGHPGGVAGAIQSLGTSNGGGNSFSTEANYTFNGSVAQFTGNTMPATVNNLVINNAAGVALSRATTINGVLRLVAGVFDNTVPFTLGPGGSISYEGGSLLLPLSVHQIDETVPGTFYVGQNYPNPFNPSTTITFGLPSGSHVAITIYNLLGQEVAKAFEGRLAAGVHQLQFDAANLPSGVYLYRIQADKSVNVKRMMLMR